MWDYLICSVFLLSKRLVSGIVVVKIAHWSNFGFRLLMLSSLLICQRGCDWIINETQCKYTKIAPVLWSSLSCCVKNVRKRGINRWQKVLLSALFWGKSVHQEDRLISLMPGDNCKWIMVYQDHLMKFYVLRPIKTRHPKEVAAQLIDLSFSFLCALVIFQSNSSTYFTAHVILKT